MDLENPVFIQIDKIVMREPFKHAFPMLSDDIKNIVKNMRENGFDRSEPIVIGYIKGEEILVDGHTRIYCANKAGLSGVWAVWKDFKNDEEALAYTVHRQVDRRNLSDAEKLRHIENLDFKRTHFKKSEGKKKPSGEIVAEMIGINKNYVSKVRYIKKYGKEEDLKMIESGKKSIHAVYARIKEELTGKGFSTKKCTCPECGKLFYI